MLDIDFQHVQLSHMFMRLCKTHEEAENGLSQQNVKL